MTMRIEGQVDNYTTEPDQHGQYLVTVYRGNGPVIRTVAWRQSPADTWGVERVLYAEGVGR